jgi:SNF family Na+-dependent transporter
MDNNGLIVAQKTKMMRSRGFVIAIIGGCFFVVGVVIIFAKQIFLNIPNGWISAGLIIIGLILLVISNGYITYEPFKNEFKNMKQIKNG